MKVNFSPKDEETEWIYRNQAARHSAQETHKVFYSIFKANRPDPLLCNFLNSKYGLPDEAINRYILAPPSLDTIPKLLKEGFYHEDLIGIPGFYETDTGKVALRTYPGTDFGIAIRSENGKILGILFHFKPQINGSKREYGWLSTKLQEKGTPSGSPIGWIGRASNYMVYDEQLAKRRPALPVELGKRGTIFLTDGFFKATACHAHYGSRALFVSGYQNTSSLSDAVSSLAERIGSPLRIVLAPDADWRNNIRMMSAYLKIIDRIYRDCTPLWIALWPPNVGKQIDHVIRDGHADQIKPKRVSKVFLPYICKWAEAEANKGIEDAKPLLDLANTVCGKVEEWERTTSK